MRYRGFSRVEVLLVVSILGCTMALLPALAQGAWFHDETGGKGDANWRQCQKNLKQLGLAVAQYNMDYDDKCPPVAVSVPYAYGWADAMDPYIPSMKLYQCPSEKHVAEKNPRRPGYTDYWYNSNLAGLEVTSVTSPASTLLFGDGDGGASNSNARYALNSLPRTWLTTPGSPARRHVDGGNYAFLDGHIRWFKPKMITTSSPTAAKQGKSINTFATH